jgi:hypothetical protein
MTQRHRKLRYLTCFRFAPRGILASLMFLLLCGTPAAARSGEKPAADKTGAKGSKLVSFAATGLPRYSPPASYREDLVVHSKNGGMTMKRFVSNGQIRTELASEGQDFVMLETGDSKGTTYTLMPEQKKAMKQTSETMAEATQMAGAKAKKKEPDARGTSAAPSDIQVEDLGEETVEGAAVKKLRMAVEGGDVLGWFDKATGAPVRMESLVNGEKATIEWKNRKAEPQPAELFTVPKSYEVTDMDEMMKKMNSMGGIGALGGLGGMAKGMAGGMAQGMGGNLGGSLGSALGGSLGGPLGAAAGQFLGGKIGGMLGKKAANAIN